MTIISYLLWDVKYYYCLLRHLSDVDLGYWSVPVCKGFNCYLSMEYVVPLVFLVFHANGNAKEDKHDSALKSFLLPLIEYWWITHCNWLRVSEGKICDISMQVSRQSGSWVVTRSDPSGTGPEIGSSHLAKGLVPIGIQFLKWFQLIFRYSTN